MSLESMDVLCAAHRRVRESEKRTLAAMKNLAKAMDNEIEAIDAMLAIVEPQATKD